jgi:hypothetical protein
MGTESGRTTKISDLQKPAELAPAPKQQLAGTNGIKSALQSLDWPTLIAVAGSAFVGQRVPLDQIASRIPWAFQMGSVPIRSLLVALLFAILQAVWLTK